jgi:hypothetical protein
MRYKVQQLFIQNNKETLKHPLLYAIDWFMPTWSGGLGMCDVSEEGYVYNYDKFPGNPEMEVDDDLKPTGKWKDFCDKRDNNEKRKKSRCALFHMLTNWNKRKYRPVSWRQQGVADNLRMIDIISQKMPIKPREQVVSYLKPEPKDNIHDSLFGLLAMDTYLTDTRTHDLIDQNYEKAINEDFNFPFIITDTKISQFTKQGEEKTIVEFKAGIRPKRKLALIKSSINVFYESEHRKRIKYNKAIWQNNIKAGCSHPASYDKIQSRKYLKIFRGTIKGKGRKFIEDVSNNVNFDYVLDPLGDWGRLSTQPKNDLWDLIM